MPYIQIKDWFTEMFGNEIVRELEDMSLYGTSDVPPGLPFGFYIRGDGW